MKNFFKKIAFVLALAMVLVSVAPATANAATKAPSLKKTSKILYIGGDLTGTISDTYRFTFNDAAGYTATWKSKNTKVVKIEGKNVVAVGVGKAEVVATLTNKAGKSVQKTATVYVKQNAEEVGFGSTKAIDSPIELGAKVKINVYRLVGDKKIWTQNDMATCTDVIKWTSSDEKVATVDKFGTVTAVGAGEATITATATQPQGPTAGESASYKVTVVSGLTGATQKDVKTVNLTFGEAVTKDKVNATTVKLYEVVGTTKVAQLVSDVAIDKNDATKATLSSYINFKKNTTYVVEYDGKTAEFVAVDPSAASVKRVVLLTNQAVKNTPTEVKYQLLTENGVDLTSVFESETTRVSIETKSTDCYFSSDKKVTFFESGKVATFKVVFHTYTYTDNGVENVIETEGAIVSVDASAITLGTIGNWTLSANGSTFDFDKNTANQKLTLSENNGLNFIGQYVKSDNSKVLTTADPKFTFESSNTSVILVNGNRLYPVSLGSATLIVKYDGKAIDAVAITVLPKRVAADIQATSNKSVLSTVGGDTAVISVVAKDNYGSDATGTVKIELLSSTNSAAVFATQTAPLVDSKASFTLNGINFAGKNGTYTFKVSLGDIARVVVVEVKTPDMASATNKVLEVTKTSIDTTLKLTAVTGSAINTGFDANIKLKIVDKNGVFVGYETATNFTYGSGADYFYELYTADGKLVGADGKVDGNEFLFLNKTNNTFSAVAENADGVMVKAPTGTYRVAYYKMVPVTNGTPVVQPLGHTFITVSDNQPTASVTLKNSVSTQTNVIGAINNKDILVALDINNDGEAEELTGGFSDPKFVGATLGDEAGKTVYVNTVVYTLKVAFGDDLKDVQIKINVGKQITLASIN